MQTIWLRQISSFNVYFLTIAILLRLKTEPTTTFRYHTEQIFRNYVGDFFSAIWFSLRFR